MEVDTFLISPRWEILQIISKKPSSPMEIAEQLNTTISYISQQLRLLEAVGLVKKQKTGAVERGKPRNLFSLSKEAVYLITLTEDLSTKKMIELTDYHKIIMKIWCIDNNKLHYPIEKLFWKIEKYLDSISGIYLDLSKIKPKIVVVFFKKGLKQKIESELKKPDLQTEVDYKVVSEEDFAKIDIEPLYKIYSKNSPFKDIEVKGGIKEHEKS